MKLSVSALAGLGLLLSSFTCFGQEDTNNIYGRENTLQFAEYLMAAQEYESAAMEFERLLFMDQESDSIRLRLLRAYRLAGSYGIGKNRFRDFYSPENPETPQIFAQEYLKLLLLSKDYDQSQHFIETNEKLPNSYKNNVELGILLLQKDWNRAQDFSASEEVNDPYLQSLAHRGTTMKKKSPLLASALSAVVPGSGKMYSGKWADGVVALLFVGGNAFGAYRGFKRNGVNSFYGWFFTAMGSGFYVGNIYGSYKAAVDYNVEKENMLHHEVENYFYTRY